MMPKHLIFSLLLLAGTSAQALQVVDAVPGQNAFARISAKEITALRIQNGQIRSVFATDGELTITKDEETSQMFIRPVVLDKPINLRVISRAGKTYNLVLQAVDIPQEDIEIREPAEARPSPYGDNPRTTTSLLYKSVRSLITGMALEKPPAHMTFKPARKEFRFWDLTRLELIGLYNERDLVGEKYTLSNQGKDLIRLVEQEFYREGVVAVSIEDHELTPGQTTFVYVVREQGNGGN
jgi:conjugal transfer pilus assembly protein TraK